MKETIADRGIKISYVLDKLGMTWTTWNRRIEGENDFSVEEAAIISKCLYLTRDEIFDIFLPDMLSKEGTNEKLQR